MSQEPQPRNAGWLSFTALFTDGDRARGSASPTAGGPLEGPPRLDLTREIGLEEQDDLASNVSDVGFGLEDSELADMRLDISDIQEAIKNHDLWVQDAAATRGDIDDLQKAIREHEGWMSNLTGIVRQTQEREDSLAQQLADLRSQVELSKRAHQANGAGELDLPGPALPQPRGAARESAPEASAPLESDRRSAKRDERTSVSELHRLVVGLDEQLNCGLRTLRTMVTSIEGSLVRQIDGERSARRAMVLEVRQELNAASKLGQRYALEDLLSQADGAGANGAPIGLAINGCAGHAHAKDAALDASTAAALGSLRAAVEALDLRTVHKSTEAERMVNDLRAELIDLRAEQAEYSRSCAVRNGQVLAPRERQASPRRPYRADHSHAFEGSGSGGHASAPVGSLSATSFQSRGAPTHGVGGVPEGAPAAVAVGWAPVLHAGDWDGARCVEMTSSAAGRVHGAPGRPPGAGPSVIFGAAA